MGNRKKVLYSGSINLVSTTAWRPLFLYLCYSGNGEVAMRMLECLFVKETICVQ